MLIRLALLSALALPIAAQQPARTQPRPAPRDSVPQQQMVPMNFDPQIATQIRYRYIGPVGNRISSVSGVVGDPNVYYAGAASGGLWKTTDAGIHWQSIMDNQNVSAIGAL